MEARSLILFMKNIIKNYSVGFTLIETLIATVIFVVIIATAIGIFGFGSSLQNKNLAIREASQNVRFIIEAIARDVRLADSFSIEDDNTIIIEKNGLTSQYHLNTDNKSIIYTDNLDDFEIENRLNSEDVNITSLLFDGIDNKTQDTQSYLNIIIDFEADIGKNQKNIETAKEKIETTVSTRAYNKGYVNKITQP